MKMQVDLKCRESWPPWLIHAFAHACDITLAKPYPLSIFSDHDFEHAMLAIMAKI